MDDMKLRLRAKQIVYIYGVLNLLGAIFNAME